MGKKDQYPVFKYWGIPLQMDNSGQYQLKADPKGRILVHTWRQGKHTKGKFVQPGQVALTENNLAVVIVKSEKWPFKRRHEETPLQRILTQQVAPSLLAKAQTQLQSIG